MAYEFRVQDPTHPRRSTLFDTLIELAQLRQVSSGRMFFGFLTGSGLDALMAVPEVAKVFNTARLHVIVGLDAVTDRAGLQRLLEITEVNPELSAMVIKNPTGSLIHPKLMILEYEDGSGVVVVGSNNMSAGGLTGNVEAYSLLHWEPEGSPDFSDLDRFIDRWQSNMSPIDADAMERAEQNERRYRRIKRALAPTQSEDDEPQDGPRGVPDAEVVISDGIAHDAPQEEDGALYEAILIALIPRAGNRWSQVHLSADIVREFFEVEPGDRDHVFLRQLDTATTEERPIVYSESSNRNVKIEVGAARDAARDSGYPADGRPIVLFRADSNAIRHYRYLLLLPGDAGHEEMYTLANQLFVGPPNQLARVVVPRSRVLRAWTECPL